MMPGQYPYQQMMPQMGYPWWHVRRLSVSAANDARLRANVSTNDVLKSAARCGYPMQVTPAGSRRLPKLPQQPRPSVVLPNPEDTGAKESDAAKGSSGASQRIQQNQLVQRTQSLNSTWDDAKIVDPRTIHNNGLCELFARPVVI